MMYITLMQGMDSETAIASSVGVISGLRNMLMGNSSMNTMLEFLIMVVVGTAIYLKWIKQK